MLSHRFLSRSMLGWFLLAAATTASAQIQGGGIWKSGTGSTGINTAGDIAGSYTDTNNEYHGFLRTAAGAITPFDAPDVSTSPCATSGIGSMACGESWLRGELG
jgi:hypothetical protein